METDHEKDDVRRQLAEIDRGAAATWVVYPPTPWFWAPAFGLWSVALVLSIGLLPSWASALGNLALVLVALGIMWWDRRRRGTWPTGRQPRELNGALAGLFAGTAVILLVCGALGVLVGVAAAAVAAFVLTTTMIWWYERVYARIAAQVREREGLG